MQYSGFFFDPEKCAACGACSVACMDQNDTDLSVMEPYRMVFEVEREINTGFTCEYLSVGCMHCEDAPCVIACPVGCLEKHENGVTSFDNSNCIGCHSCMMACPFAAPRFGRDGKMEKCDGCVARTEYGLMPACVKNCPTGALVYLKDDENKQLLEEKALNLIALKTAR